MKNRYFILPVPNKNSSIWDIVVEDINTIKKNIQGNKCMVKLYLGDERQHNILVGAEELTYEQAHELIRSSEWKNEEI